MRCAPASPARTASWARLSIAKALKTAPMSHIVPASSRRDLLLSTTLLGAGMAAAAPSQASAAAAAAAAGGAPAAQAVGGVTRAELAGLSISQVHVAGCGSGRRRRESKGAAALNLSCVRPCHSEGLPTYPINHSQLPVALAADHQGLLAALGGT